jgi:membrane protease YdiL (CAAX protease family)
LSSFDNPQFDPPPPPSEPQAPLPLAAEAFPPPYIPPAPKADENPLWNGWDVLQIGALGLLFTLIVVPFIVVSLTHFLIVPHQSWADIARKPVIALLSEFLAYLLVLLLMILTISGKYHASFGQAIRWNWPGSRGFAPLLIGCFMLGFDALGRFLPMPKTTPFDQFFERPMDAYLVAAFAITFGPLMEEFFFRGFLYPVLARRIGTAWGIFITGVLFGLIHLPQYGYSWAAGLIVCLVGIVLTTVRAVTKSVGCSFLAHVGYNGTLMVLAIAATDGFKHMEKAGMLMN